MFQLSTLEKTFNLSSNYGYIWDVQFFKTNDQEFILIASESGFINCLYINYDENKL